MKKRWQDLAVTIFLGGVLVYTVACVLSPISWSPDGRWIAVTRFVPKEGNPEDAEGTELWVLSPTSPERNKLMATSGTILSGPGWSSDSKTLYVVDVSEGDQSATLWSVGLDGKRNSIIKLKPSGDAESAYWGAPAASPDGRRIAFITDDATVVVVQRNGKIERKIEVSEPGPLAWSPDGRWLTLLAGGNGGSVQFMDVTTSHSLSLDPKYRWVAWLPSGDRLVAWKADESTTPQHSVALLDVKADMKEVAAYALDFEPGAALLPSRKGDALFTGSNMEDNGAKEIRRVDLRNGKTSVLYNTPGLVVPGGVSPDGKRLAFRESMPVKRNGINLESIVGVLEVDKPESVVYLAVDESQWVAVIEPGLVALESIPTGESLDKSENDNVRLTIDRLNQYLAAYERQYPDSEKRKETAARMKKVQAALHGAKIGLPESGMQW